VQFLVRRQFATLGMRVAVIFTLGLLALFAVETVSLHTIDAIFYRPVGPVLLIGWLWAAASAGICAAAALRWFGLEANAF
jgi:hypothetical protein